MPVKHNPSKQEILRACKKFQESWSDEDRNKRAGVIEKAYQVPQVEIEPSYNEFSREESTRESRGR